MPEQRPAPARGPRPRGTRAGPGQDYAVENTASTMTGEGRRAAPASPGERHAQVPQEAGQPSDIAHALRRSWLLIAIITVVGAAFLCVAVTVQPTLYTSQALIEISSDNSTPVLTGRSIEVSNDRARVLNTEANVFLSDSVVDPVASTLKRDREWIREHVQVVTAKDSDVLTVNATAGSAAEAQQIAGQLSVSYQKYSQNRGVQELQAQASALQGPIDALKGSLTNLPAAAVDQRAAVGDQLGKLTQQQEQIFAAARVYRGQAQVLSAATLPARPSTMTIPMALAIGGALGLVIGATLAIARRAAANRSRFV